MFSTAGMTPPRPALAPHETIELHELLSFKSVSLVKMKEAVGKVTDPVLQQLYLHNIRMTEGHIAELMQLLQHRALLP
ncbi:coat protein F [Paenibacillus chartarius]|uniref:Coat protein F n=1 Tax=Paenibacillus chartarius TaxID=747481 RepID=A0ABV6DKE7_9BACL